MLIKCISARSATQVISNAIRQNKYRSRNCWFSL